MLYQFVFVWKKNKNLIRLTSTLKGGGGKYSYIFKHDKYMKNSNVFFSNIFTRIKGCKSNVIKILTCSGLHTL